jgi:hypothetical protein
VEEQRHQLLTSALDGDEWSTSRPCYFTTGAVISGKRWRGRWVLFVAGLGDLERRKYLAVAIESYHNHFTDCATPAVAKVW